MTGLERRFREGTGADDASIAGELSAPPADEVGFARALAVALDAPLGRAASAWTPPAELGARATADSSFLARLGIEGSAAEPGIHQLADVRTLLAVARGGSARQRRAAVQRLGELADALESEERGRVDEVLGAIRDEDLALEIARVRARIGVSNASELAAEDAHAARLLSDLEAAIPRFYEGDLELEPLAALDAEARALVGSRLAGPSGPSGGTRSGASELVCSHVAALLEGAVGASDEVRLAVLGAVRSAGDPRLVPVLGALLDAPSRDLALEAARALGRVEQPSARVLLAAAFRRRTTPADRAVLAGMLALHGDTSVLAELRETVRAEDPRARLAAVEAIGPVATSEDFEPLASLLGTGSLALDRALVRSLGSLGDARAVRLLRGLRATDRGPALGLDIEDAMRAVRAQMELRGEKDVPEGAIEPVMTRAESPFWARTVAHLHIAIAALLARLGMYARAVRRLDRATVRARDLASPWVAKGRLFEARGSSAEALVVFRRAIEIDRPFVERTPLAVRSVARAFLRRAEATAREGRRDVARGLLDEVLALDLRRVPAPLRQAIAREREKLAREEGA